MRWGSPADTHRRGTAGTGRPFHLEPLKPRLLLDADIASFIEADTGAPHEPDLSTPVLVAQDTHTAADPLDDAANASATVIHNVDDLQAMADDLAGHYVLGGDIDASATADWPHYDAPDALDPIFGSLEPGRSKADHELWREKWHVVPYGDSVWGDTSTWPGLNKYWYPIDGWEDKVASVDNTRIMGTELGNPLPRNFQHLAHWLMRESGLPDLVLGQAPMFTELDQAEGYNHALNHAHPHVDHEASDTSEIMVDAGGDVVINEGELFTRTGSFDGSAEGATWEGVIYWRDGMDPDPLAVEPIEIDAGTQTFELVRNLSTSGEFEVRVAIRSSEGHVGEDVFKLTVLNVAPPVDPTTIRFEAGEAARFVDGQGAEVTVRLHGAGEAEVVFNDTVEVKEGTDAPHEVTGDDLWIQRIQLRGTDADSTLAIQVRGGDEVTQIEEIDVDGDLGRLLGPRVALAGT